MQSRNISSHNTRTEWTGRKGLARARVPSVSHAVDLHGRLETLASDILLHPVYQVDAQIRKVFQDVCDNIDISLIQIKN